MDDILQRPVWIDYKAHDNMNTEQLYEIQFSVVDLQDIRKFHA